MNMEKLFIKSQEYDLSLGIYACPNPKAIVQIAHGMQEHKERYENFASFLNQNGFLVVTADMRGHGYDADKLGHFNDRDGYKLLVADQVEIAKFIKNRYPALPLYLFAHSMGTIISRVVLQKHSALYDKVILSGYPCYQKGTHFGKFLADIIMLFKGKDGYSTLLNNLVVGNFNKAVENPETDVDWISHNKENIKNYIDDPYCGFNFTIAALKDLMSLVCLMHNHNLYKNINNSIRILLLRGKDDPCVGGDKGASDSKNVLVKAGFKNIESIDYDNMRHEILSESEHDKVYADALNFFNA